MPTQTTAEVKVSSWRKPSGFMTATCTPEHAARPVAYASWEELFRSVQLAYSKSSDTHPEQYGQHEISGERSFNSFEEDTL